MTATRVLIPLAVILAATPAYAQEAPRDPIAAEALFERGKQLTDQGRTPEACVAFAESERLDPAGGTLLRLALCHETQGKLASAWLEFLEVQRLSAEATGDPVKLGERVRIAREHLAAIGPRVPKLVIVVPTATRVPGLRVTANDLPRNEGSWGVPLPVDPGDISVEAGAPGHRPWRAVVRAVEGQQTNVEIVPLVPDAPPAAPAPPARGSHASIARPLGIAIGGAGLVALGVGGYFGGRAISRWNASNASCPGTSCATPDGVTLAGQARDSARVADVAIAFGAAALVAGVILYVVGAPPSSSPRALAYPLAVDF